MARLVMTTVGSAGDLHPYIALASGLRQRGHEIVFAVEQSFARRLRAEGFAAQELRGDVRTLLGPYAHDMIDSSIGFRSLRTLSHHYLAPVLGENITLLRDICEGADALIGSAGQIAASAVADLTGIPWMSVALSPAIPTEFVSPITGAAQSGAINRVINRVAWTLGELALQRASDPPLNAVRSMYGLPPRKRLLADGNLSPAFTGVAVSPTFFARPADWPASAQVTGFLYWDTPSAWRAPPELEAFFSGGRPVIAVSTGSLGPDTSDLFSQFFAASVAAIHRVGARALVIGAGTAYSTAGPETLLIEYAPFSLVYPRCAAVIHHGGSGTLAQSLRAGVPTLVAPWGADQFFHAALLKRAGVSRTLARKSYTAERARAALTTLLHDTGIRRHAQELANAIAQEDGCATLCDAIEGRLLANAAR